MYRDLFSGDEIKLKARVLKCTVSAETAASEGAYRLKSIQEASSDLWTLGVERNGDWVTKLIGSFTSVLDRFCVILDK